MVTYRCYSPRGVPSDRTGPVEGGCLNHNRQSVYYDKTKPRSPPTSVEGRATNQEKTPNNGCLGSRNDEERSEMRYVV